MTAISAYRDRALVAVLTATVAGFVGWWTVTYRPRMVALSELETRIREQQVENREARKQFVELGLSGIEEEIGRLRQEASAARRWVPDLGNRAAAESRMTERVTEVARRYGVQVFDVDTLAAVVEGPFQVDGFRFRAAGRYDDLGSFLADILSSERITQLRSARLQAVPDSLMRRVLNLGDSPARTVASAATSPEAVLPAGVPPFAATLDFTLQWFSTLPGPGDTGTTVSAAPGEEGPSPAPAAAY